MYYKRFYAVLWRYAIRASVKMYLAFAPLTERSSGGYRVESSTFPGDCSFQTA